MQTTQRQHETAAPEPTILHQLEEVADFLELLQMLFRREVAEELTVSCGVARWLAARCIETSTTVWDVVSDLHDAHERGQE